MGSSQEKCYAFDTTIPRGMAGFLYVSFCPDTRYRKVKLDMSSVSSPFSSNNTPLMHLGTTSLSAFNGEQLVFNTTGSSSRGYLDIFMPNMFERKSINMAGRSGMVFRHSDGRRKNRSTGSESNRGSLRNRVHILSPCAIRFIFKYLLIGSISLPDRTKMSTCV